MNETDSDLLIEEAVVNLFDELADNLRTVVTLLNMAEEAEGLNERETKLRDGFAAAIKAYDDFEGRVAESG